MQEAHVRMRWAGWRVWVQATLTAKGSGFSKKRSTAIDKAEKVEFINDDDGCAAVVRWRDKARFAHREGLRVTQ